MEWSGHTPQRARREPRVTEQTLNLVTGAPRGGCSGKYAAKSESVARLTEAADQVRVVTGAVRRTGLIIRRSWVASWGGPEVAG